MTSAVRFQVLQGMDRGYDAQPREVRASIEMRRAAVLSYEQLVATHGLVHHFPPSTLAVMPAPASREEARGVNLREAISSDSFGEPSKVPTAAVRPVGAAKAAQQVVTEPTLKQQMPVDLARDPLAYPTSPARPQGAAKPVYHVVTEPMEQEDFGEESVMAAREIPAESQKDVLHVEPVEPAAEPRHRGTLHGGNENPVRSMLSPSQRAALKRPETRLDRDGRQTYITYTVDTTGKK